MTKTFAVTWDYRCPFARNAHEHLIEGLQSGADWDVQFVGFSLDRTHLVDGQPPGWDDPERLPGRLANLAGIVVRDRFPEHFLAAHGALFAARHDQAHDLRDRDVLATVLDEAGVDSAAVLAEIDAGWPLKVLEAEHSDAAERLSVFGVPTFVMDDQAVFVRLMNRPNGDSPASVATIERVLDLLGGWPDLNEFKHTSISR
jgi:hypothetical protein